MKLNLFILIIVIIESKYMSSFVKMFHRGNLPMSHESSYFFGNDTISGWGPRYFFSFYSEYGQERSETIFEVSSSTAIFLISTVANGMIAAAALKYSAIRSVTNCFLLNLTAADILFVAGIPALIYTRLKQEWALGNYACKILPYSQFVCGFVLLWTQTWISMDRYWCLAVPPYRSKLTPKRACLFTTLTWLIAFIVFLPVALWFREQTTDNQLRICTLVFPKNDVVDVSTLFLVPTLLLSCITPLTMFVFYNQRIYRKLNETNNRWKKIYEKQFISNKPKILSQKEKIRLNKHVRAIRVLLLNVLVVLILWLPITGIMFCIYVDGTRPNHNTNFFLRSHHFFWTLLIALLITVFNPLVHGVMSESFRKSFQETKFLSKWGKGQKQVDTL